MAQRRDDEVVVWYAVGPFTTPPYVKPVRTVDVFRVLSRHDRLYHWSQQSLSCLEIANSASEIGRVGLVLQLRNTIPSNGLVGLIHFIETRIINSAMNIETDL